MKTRVVIYTFVKSWCILFCARFVQAEWTLDNSDIQVVKRVVIECLNNGSYSCFAERASRALERAINWDVPIFEGITFTRNKEKLIDLNLTPRSLNGFDRLKWIVSRFLDAHTLTLNLGEVRELTEDEPESKIGGGGKRRISKRERKYVQYALLVLLGIFSLTTPVILKILGIIALKALISSKVALIMLGSVALKKIFKEDHDSGVKVHTHTIPIHEDDHDRYMDAAAYNYVKGS